MMNQRLYHRGSCGLCRRAIEHLRGRLEPALERVDIGAPASARPVILVIQWFKRGF